MNRLLFVLDKTYTLKHQLFTVTLSERIRDAEGRFVHRGPKRVYSFQDLATLQKRFENPDLLRKCIQSELQQLKLEGRFFSPQDTATRLRIASDQLPHFLETATRETLLVHADGSPVTFQGNTYYKAHLKINPAKDGYGVSLWCGPTNYKDVLACFDSLPPIGFTSQQFFTMHRAIQITTLNSIPQDQTLSNKELRQLLDRLGHFKEAWTLPNLDAGRKVYRNSPIYPVLDMGQHFQYAHLFFEYPEGKLIEETDTHSLVEDPLTHTEWHRHVAEEKSYVEMLKGAGASESHSAYGRWYLPSHLLEKMLRILEELGFILKHQGKIISVSPKLEWHTTHEGNHIRLGGTLTFDNHKCTISDCIEALATQAPGIPLDDQTLGFISEGLKERLLSLAPYATIEQEDILLPSAQFTRVHAFLEGQDDKALEEGGRGLHHLSNLSTPGKLEAHPVPPTLLQVLRPYQKIGYYWLTQLCQQNLNGLLADDMGLGKTIQVLCLLLARSKQNQPSLLIVPASLVFNWQEEIQKFTPELKVFCFAGKDRGDLLTQIKNVDIVITTYALARLETEGLQQVSWNFLILDESQIIKNPKAAVSQAVKILSSNHRLALTGTPVENRMDDLWSQYDFLMPGFLGNHTQFKEAYPPSNPDSLLKLKTLIQPFLLRRMKSEVLTELPPKTEVILHCEMSPSQLKIYQDYHKNSRTNFQPTPSHEAPSNKRFALLEILLRLRQISCHPALVQESIDPEQSSGKLNEIGDMAESILAEGHKILCFSQFTSFLKIIQKAMHQRELKTFYLDGQTRNRPKVIKDFQKHPLAALFLISLKAGGTGLNLTEADYVFITDPWWNPAAENQAIDRAHRIGQESPVTIYRFLSKDTVEEKVAALQAQKKNLEASLIESSDAPLTEADLEALLE